MIDIICVGAIYFGAFCSVAALLCAVAAVLERFPRFADKLCRVILPKAKKKTPHTCDCYCRYYGNLAENDERFAFCYKYHELTDGGCKGFMHRKVREKK